jgi:hypothetical protein
MRKKTKPLVKSKKPELAQTDASLFSDIRSLIQSTREKVAQTVNSGHVLLYWSIGKRILNDVLRNKRAEYGREIVSALGRQLTKELRPGFTRNSTS